MNQVLSRLQRANSIPALSHRGLSTAAVVVESAPKCRERRVEGPRYDASPVTEGRPSSQSESAEHPPGRNGAVQWFSGNENAMSYLLSYLGDRLVNCISCYSLPSHLFSGLFASLNRSVYWGSTLVLLGGWHQPVPRGILTPGRCSFSTLITVYVDGRH